MSKEYYVYIMANKSRTAKLYLIPDTLAPFFQEYDLACLNPQRDAPILIERTLQFGNRSELRWLFRMYSQEKICEWVRRFGKERLPQPHRTFWQTVLEISL